MKEIDLIGFGAVTVDDLIYVDHYPIPDSKIPIIRYERQGGGLAGTALVTAARLGARAAYCGSFGYDELSCFTLDEFKQEGIDLRYVIRKKDAAPIHSIIIVDNSTGKRVVLHTGSGLSSPSYEFVTNELISSCKYIFIDHTVMKAALKAAILARLLEVQVIADIERDDDKRLPELIELVDHLVINQSMANKLTGVSDPAYALNELMHPNQSVCIITAGSGGCYYKIKSENVVHFPAFKFKIVDTTGCGDVFHGAYIAGLIRGYSIQKSIIYATAAAGLKVSHHGGRSGIPTQTQLIQFLSSQGYE